jgi:hypothetical protein
MSNPYRDKLLSVGVMPRGRKKDVNVKEYKDNAGARVKETIDEFGNSTIEHNTKDDRVDVTIRPKIVDLSSQLKGAI